MIINHLHIHSPRVSRVPRKPQCETEGSLTNKLYSRECVPWKNLRAGLVVGELHEVELAELQHVNVAREVHRDTQALKERNTQPFTL
jgi:hypothetical protein